MPTRLSWDLKKNLRKRATRQGNRKPNDLLPFTSTKRLADGGKLTRMTKYKHAEKFTWNTPPKYNHANVSHISLLHHILPF